MHTAICSPDISSKEAPSRFITDHGSDFEVFVTGDVHGSAWNVCSRLGRFAHEMRPDSGDVIIWAGDVGISYGVNNVCWEVLDAMESFGLSCGVRCVIMRGNHDVRYCRDIVADKLGPWHVDKLCDAEMLCLDAYPHVLFVADSASRLLWRGLSVLLIPGAFSVDREIRSRFGWPYEDEEQLTWAEWEHVLDLVDVGADVVISHTCPESWMDSFSDLLIPGLDQSQIDRSMERGMDVVLERLGDRCRSWLFGHFHDDRAIPGTCGRMLLSDVVRLSDEIR